MLVRKTLSKVVVIASIGLVLAPLPATIAASNTVLETQALSEGPGYGSIPDIEVPSKGVLGQIQTDDGITFSIEKTYDGNWGEGDEHCFINSDNGFPVGDNGPLDGIACVQSSNLYKISYSITPSDIERTFSFTQNSYPEALPGYEESSRDLVGNRGLRKHGADAVDGEKFSQFCDIGVIPGATVKRSFGEGGSSTCTITIPASEQSLAGTFSLAENNSGRVDLVPANRYVSTEWKLANATSESTLKTPKTLVVDAPFIDPVIFGYINGGRDKPRPYSYNGEDGMIFTYGVLYIQSKFDYKRATLQYDTDVELLDPPKGAALIPDDNNVSVEGNIVHYKAGINYAINGHAGKYNTPSPTDDFFFYNTPFIFKVFVPKSTLEETPDIVLKAHIKEDRTSVHDGGPYMNMYGANFKQPGAGQPHDFLTKNTGSVEKTSPYYSQWHFMDNNNNDWSIRPYHFDLGNGPVKKNEYPNNDDPVFNVNVKSGGIEEQGDFGQQLVGSPSTKYWSTTKVHSQLTTAEPVFYEIIDNDQKFDADRQARVLWRESANGDLVDVPFTIQYGHANLKYPSMEGQLPNESAESRHDDKKNLDARLAIVTDENIQWSNEIKSDSNVAKIIVTGEKSWVSSNQIVGVVGIPTTGLEPSHYNFSEKDYYEIDDRWLTGYQNDGSYTAIGTSHASHRIEPPTFGISGWPDKKESIIAGASKEYNGSIFRFEVSSQNSRLNEPDKNLLTDPSGSFNMKISSCAEKAEITDDRVEVTSVEKPDFGPDELACTDDDIHGWIISGTTKPSMFEEYNPRNDDNGGRGILSKKGNFDWVEIKTRISVPNYATAKDQVSISTTYNPNWTETRGGLKNNRASNNTSVITIPIRQIQSVIQAKASLNTLEFSGTDIGWTMRFGNTTSG
uniref:hypothetical protein n=1 Tax=Actinomyces vulturis TaxID=1857645 RepID=UPI00159EBF71